jgi:hypothetical protein
VCRGSYINPRLVELYEQHVTIAPALAEVGTRSPATVGAAETAVRRLLRDDGLV